MLVDELSKKHIWQKVKKKQKWSKLKYIDISLLVLSIYCACFTIFYCVFNPDYTYFYGPFGNITTHGRILTMFLRTIIVYISTSIPYLIVHFFYIITAGEDLVTRFKENIEIEDQKFVTYKYRELLHPFTQQTVTFNIKEIEKVTYSEDTNKIHIYGNMLQDTKNKKEHYSKDIDIFTLFSYFTPDILHLFEDNNIKVEYLFFSNNKNKKSKK